MERPGTGRDLSAPAPREIIIITGPVNGGKTTFTADLVEEKRAEGLSVRGVLSVAETVHEPATGMQYGEKVSYSFVDLVSGMEAEFAVLKGERAGLGHHRFEFLQDGFLFAEAILTGALDADVLVVDEVGPLELGGGGLMGTLKYLVANYPGTLVVTVRESLVAGLLDALALAGPGVNVIRVPERER